MEDRHLADRMVMDAYGRFDVVATVAVGGDLYEFGALDHAVIGAHGALFLQT